MSKRVKPKRTDSFESEVQRRFGPVAQRWGLAGPVEGGVVIPTVKYHAGPLTYTWMFDDEDRALSVSVDLRVGGHTWSAYLQELVTGAGLGAAQEVRTSAQTWVALQSSIDSHISWLERLHPRLSSPEGVQFMTGAGVRAVNPEG
jgi:hypothetical protein